MRKETNSKGNWTGREEARKLEHTTKQTAKQATATAAHKSIIVFNTAQKGSEGKKCSWIRLDSSQTNSSSNDICIKHWGQNDNKNWKFSAITQAEILVNLECWVNKKHFGELYFYGPYDGKRLFAHVPKWKLLLWTEWSLFPW